MKNKFKKSMIALTILLSLTGIAQAGDSISFSVSCTIPAIPGVNAPPFIEEKTVKTDVTTPVQQEIETQEETKEEKPAMIQEETEEIVLAEQKNSPVILQTFYSR